MLVSEFVCELAIRFGCETKAAFSALVKKPLHFARDQDGARPREVRREDREVGALEVARATRSSNRVAAAVP